MIPTKIYNKNTEKNGHFNIRNLHQWYRAICKSKNPIRFDVFSSVIKEFNNEICKEIIYNKFEFHLPARLGTIRIKKYKPKIKLDENGKLNLNQFPIDWKKTKEVGKKVYHLNRHFDGYRIMWYWNKLNSNVRNQSVYKFKEARQYQVESGRAVLNPNINIDYYE